MAQGVRLCALHELPEGTSRGFDPTSTGRDTVFLVRRGKVLRAYRNACPHLEGAPMAWRKDAYLNGDGSRIICHGHGAQFDIDSGLCLSGPCLGQSLQQLQVVVDIDGAVSVMLDRPFKAARGG